MVIDLRDIVDVPRHFNFVLEPKWWRNKEKNDQILGLDGPLKVYASISKKGTKYLLNGSLSGGIEALCDRCAESYHRDLRSEFELILAIHSEIPIEGEVALSEDDLPVDFITDYKIELNDIVRDQIYLSMPMQSLCREDCAGLCYACGTDLNKNTCDCTKEKGHPGFSKLKNLF